MDWQDYAMRMATLARQLLAQESADATLERITGSALEIVEGCDAAGILVLSGSRVHTLAPTDAGVVLSDEAQGRLGEGPCFHAACHDTDGRVFRIEDLTEHHDRWPRFTAEARRLGIGSMMGFLLHTEEEELGALNLYAKRPAAFTSVSETAGWLLASHAAVALSGARHADQLHQALESRHTIGEAIGILMERHRLSENDAFDTMRRLSQEHNTKLRDIAHQVCETHGDA